MWPSGGGVPFIAHGSIHVCQLCSVLHVYNMRNLVQISQVTKNKKLIDLDPPPHPAKSSSITDLD